MTVAGGMGILKFMSVLFYGIVIITIIAGIINGFIVYKKTGDAGMLLDETLGEVVNWDAKIKIAMDQLTDESSLMSIPVEIRSEYTSAIAKGVLINLFLFLLLGYALFRFGNWLIGLQQFSAFSDVIVMVSVVGVVFFVIPLIYGHFVGEKATFFLGVYSFITNFDVWWAAMGGIVTTGGVAALPTAENITSVILT